MEIKKRLFYWAYLDLERTNDRDKIYFTKYAEEIGRKNMSTICYLSAFFVVLCLFMSITASDFFEQHEAHLLYATAIVIELIFFGAAFFALKKFEIRKFYTVFSALYLEHILAGAAIAASLSHNKSSTVFLIAIIISQVIFLMPPYLTASIAVLNAVCVVIASQLLSSEIFFDIDIINCFGVFVFSVMLGWLVNKVRIRDGFARFKAIEMNDELQTMSITDQLTGLPNYRNFHDTYQKMFEAARAEGTPIGIIVIDIDQFKAYNDNYGHVKGDRCLSDIGKIFRKCRRDDMFICRFGGEEFVALLEASACPQAAEIAETMRMEVKNLAIPHDFSGVANVVTVSAGLYVGIPGEGDAPMGLIDKADRTMYRSKAEGGNRTTVYDDIMTEAHKRAVSKVPSNGSKKDTASGKKRKILIVDDMAVNRQLLRKILWENYELLEAENGRNALDVLSRNYASISAVLLDIVMPVMDGYEVLRQMREDVCLSQIPVIVTTVSDDEDAEVKALALGANDFIVKPYKAGVIKHRLNNTINLRETAAMINSVERDSLTGAYNKEFFYKKAENILWTNLGRRYDIICCDIERFKLINELFGEGTGNSILRNAAAILMDNAGDLGICGRIGPDQFACLVPHMRVYSRRDFELISERINESISKISINISYGVYEVSDMLVPVRTMCDRAFTACNSVKGKYGTSFAYYDDSLRKKNLYTQFILNGMEKGIEEKQFQVYYQPKINLMTGELSGAEALVRWVHPKKGFIAPNEFIPIFEKNGFITDLDLYVWDTVCRDLSQWIAGGYKPIPISVNVSRADFYNPRLSGILTGLMEKYGLEPRFLALEITETAYTEDSKQLIHVINELKGLGFSVQMDDFGTGYSSLNILSRLPISALKLDMDFVQTKMADVRKEKILDFIVNLANMLNLPVVAEGVETEEQARKLRDMGCGYAQGYYFARPMPKMAFTNHLESLQIKKNKE